MLFVAGNIERADLNDDEKCEVLMHLLDGYNYQKNLLVIPPLVVKGILESNFFGNLHKRMAGDVKYNSREYFGLVDELNVHVFVDFSDEADNGVWEETVSGHRIRVSYKRFLSPDLAKKINFVVEGRDDFDFFDLVFRYYTKHCSKLKLKSNLIFRLGGGHQSKVVFDGIEDELVLCVLDSDKKHPRSGEGGTSGAFEVHDKSYSGVKFAYVLGVRELECIIPLAILESQIDPGRSNLFDTLDGIKQAIVEEPNLKGYFDFKNGMLIEECSQLDQRYGEFWNPIITKLKELNLGVYSCQDNREFVPGFGDKILNRVTEYLRNYNLANLSRDLDDVDAAHWEEIGGMLEAWGCAHSYGLVRS